MSLSTNITSTLPIFSFIYWIKLIDDYFMSGYGINGGADNESNSKQLQKST